MRAKDSPSIFAQYTRAKLLFPKFWQSITQPTNKNKTVHINQTSMKPKTPIKIHRVSTLAKRSAARKPGELRERERDRQSRTSPPRIFIDVGGGARIPGPRPNRARAAPEPKPVTLCGTFRLRSARPPELRLFPSPGLCPCRLLAVPPRPPLLRKFAWIFGKGADAAIRWWIVMALAAEGFVRLSRVADWVSSWISSGMVNFSVRLGNLV